jgi:hypothetical protein
VEAVAVYSHCEVLGYLRNPANLMLDRRKCEKKYDGQSIRLKLLNCVSATGYNKVLQTTNELIIIR